MSLPTTTWIYRACLAFAACVFLNVLSGATITSSHLGATVGFLPMHSKPHGHVPLGWITMLLAVVLAVRTRSHGVLGRLALSAVGLSLLAGALGAASGKNLGPYPAIGHALIAHTLFCLSCAMSLYAHPSFGSYAEPFVDQGSPSLRSLARYLPAIVFSQMLLGAFYRHNAIGLAPHLLGACAAGGILFYVCTGIMTVASKYQAINTPASALLWVTIVQMALGVAAYYGRVANGGQSAKIFPATIYTLTHTASGALTLAVTVLLSIQIFRHVQSQEENSLAGARP